MYDILATSSLHRFWTFSMVKEEVPLNYPCRWLQPAHCECAKCAFASNSSHTGRAYLSVTIRMSGTTKIRRSYTVTSGRRPCCRTLRGATTNDHSYVVGLHGRELLDWYVRIVCAQVQGTAWAVYARTGLLSRGYAGTTRSLALTNDPAQAPWVASVGAICKHR